MPDGKETERKNEKPTELVKKKEKRKGRKSRNVSLLLFYGARKDRYHSMLITLLAIWLALNAFLVNLIIQSRKLSPPHYFLVLFFAAVFGTIFNFTLNSSVGSTTRLHDEAKSEEERYQNEVQPSGRDNSNTTNKGLYQRWVDFFQETYWIRRVYAFIGVLSIGIWVLAPFVIWYFLYPLDPNHCLGTIFLVLSSLIPFILLMCMNNYCRLKRRQKKRPERTELDSSIASAIRKQFGSKRDGMPYHKLLGIEVSDLKYRGEAQVSIKYDGKLVAFPERRYMHGGVLASLADAAMAVAFATLFDKFEDRRKIVVEWLSIDYKKPVIKGDVYAQATVESVFKGGKSAKVSARIYVNGERKPSAKADGIFLIKKGTNIQP